VRSLVYLYPHKTTYEPYPTDIFYLNLRLAQWDPFQETALVAAAFGDRLSQQTAGVVIDRRKGLGRSSGLCQVSNKTD
jgi:hypothetical protein